MAFWDSIKEKIFKKKIPKKPLPLHIEKILKAPSPNLEVPLKAVRYVVFDTETTGLKKDAELVAIGAVGIQEGRVVLSDTFFGLIKPKADIPANSIFVHGITPSMVENSPEVEEMLLKFIEFCQQDILVGYHAGFDLMFINREMKHSFGINLPNITLDVVKLFRFLRGPSFVLDPQEEDFSLDTVAKELNVVVFDRHDVGGDAIVTAIIFQKLLGELEKKNMQLKDLIKIAKI